MKSTVDDPNHSWCFTCCLTNVMENLKISCKSNTQIRLLTAILNNRNMICVYNLYKLPPIANMSIFIDNCHFIHQSIKLFKSVCKEVQSVNDCIQRYNLVLSANYHVLDLITSGKSLIKKYQAHNTALKNSTDCRGARRCRSSLSTIT